MQTYASLITPPGEGGISVLHLFGPRANTIIQQVFRRKNAHTKSISNCMPGRLYLGYIHDHKSKGLIDEVIIHCIPPRQSPTGLDTIEINAHGGTAATQKIISRLKSLGVRLITAEKILSLAPKNNNKPNLIRREAQDKLLRAQTRLASLIYLAQHQGQLDNKIKQLIKYLKTPVKFKNIITARSLTKALLNSASLGLALSYPRRIVIIGRPNAGKSTLFNSLLKKERVITHHLPGTTRDAVEETIAIQGLPCRLIDTAGLKRKTKEIERLAQSTSLNEFKQANMVIVVLDGSQPLHGSDLGLIKEAARKNGLVVINKNDLPQRIDIKEIETSLRGAERGSNLNILKISALQGTGIDRLKKEILDMLLPDAATLSEETISNQPIIFTHRQYKLLGQAQRILEKITVSTAPQPKKSGLKNARATLASILSK